jgi:hypothetical protein
MMPQDKELQPHHQCGVYGERVLGKSDPPPVCAAHLVAMACSMLPDENSTLTLCYLFEKNTSVWSACRLSNLSPNGSTQVPNYKGDGVIIEFPVAFVLTRFLAPLPFSLQPM